MKVHLAYVTEYCAENRLIGVFAKKESAYKAARKEMDRMILEDRILWDGVCRRNINSNRYGFTIKTHEVL